MIRRINSDGIQLVSAISRGGSIPLEVKGRSGCNRRTKRIAIQLELDGGDADGRRGGRAERDRLRHRLIRSWRGD